MIRKVILVTVMMLAGTAVFANTPTALPEGKWKLTAYNFRPKIAFPIDKLTVTLNIKGDKIGGRSGCNVYGGGYAFEDGRLKVGDMISTMMACEEPAMQFERLYTQTLREATEFTLENDVLTITDPKTFSFVRFERVEETKDQPSKQ